MSIKDIHEKLKGILADKLNPKDRILKGGYSYRDLTIGRPPISKSEREKRNALALAEVNSKKPKREILEGYVGKGGRDEYYTPKEVAKALTSILNLKDGDKVLEPSAGIGRITEFLTKEKDLNIEQVELTPEAAKINHLLHPHTNLQQGKFQDYAQLQENNSFDAIITNVPFGVTEGGVGDKNYSDWDRIDFYFIAKSLELLKYGKRAVFIVPSSIVGASEMPLARYKRTIAKLGAFIGAIRLPNKVFSETGADVVTDIVVFEKHPKNIVEMAQKNMIENLEVLLEANEFITGRYFKKNPKDVLGVELSSKEVQQYFNDFGEYPKNMVATTKGLDEIYAQINKKVAQLKVRTNPIDYNLIKIKTDEGVTSIGNFDFEEYERREAIFSAANENPETINPDNPEAMKSFVRAWERLVEGSGEGVVVGYLKRYPNLVGILAKMNFYDKTKKFEIPKEKRLFSSANEPSSRKYIDKRLVNEKIREWIVKENIKAQEKAHDEVGTFEYHQFSDFYEIPNPKIKEVFLEVDDIFVNEKGEIVPAPEGSYLKALDMVENSTAPQTIPPLTDEEWELKKRKMLEALIRRKSSVSIDSVSITSDNMDMMLSLKKSDVEPYIEDAKRQMLKSFKRKGRVGGMDSPLEFLGLYSQDDEEKSFLSKKKPFDIAPRNDIEYNLARNITDYYGLKELIRNCNVMLETKKEDRAKFGKSRGYDVPSWVGDKSSYMDVLDKVSKGKYNNYLYELEDEKLKTVIAKSQREIKNIEQKIVEFMGAKERFNILLQRAVPLKKAFQDFAVMKGYSREVDYLYAVRDALEKAYPSLIEPYAKEFLRKMKRRVDNILDVRAKTDKSLRNQLEYTIEKTATLKKDDNKDNSKPLTILKGFMRDDAIASNHPYQNEDIRNFGKTGRGVIGADTGLGKTRIILGSALYSIVTNTAKRLIIAVPNAVFSNYKQEIAKIYTDKAMDMVMWATSKDAVEQWTKFTKEKSFRIFITTHSVYGTFAFKDETITYLKGNNIEDLRAGEEWIPTKIRDFKTSDWETVSRKDTKIGVFETGQISRVYYDEGQNVKNSLSGGKGGIRYASAIKASREGLVHRVIQTLIGETCLASATPYTSSPYELYTALVNSGSIDFDYSPIRSLEEFEKAFMAIEKFPLTNVTDPSTSRLVSVFMGFESFPLLRQLGLEKFVFRTAEEVGVEGVKPDKETISSFVNSTDEVSEKFQTIIDEARELREILREGEDNLWSEEQTLAELEKRGLKFKTLRHAESEASVFSVIAKMERLAISVDYADNKITLSIKGVKNKEKLVDDLLKKKVSVVTYTIKYDKDGKEKEVAKKENTPISSLVTKDELWDKELDTITIPYPDFKILKWCFSKKASALSEDYPLFEKVIENVRRELDRKPKAKQLLYVDTHVARVLLMNILENAIKTPKDVYIIDPDNTKFKPKKGDNEDTLIKIQNFYNSSTHPLLFPLTKKYTVGVNLQVGTTAIHVVTPPLNPSDMKQLEGRGRRQGNPEKIVRLYEYGMADTFDEAKYRIISSKSAWQDKIKSETYKARVASGQIDGKEVIAKATMLQELHSISFKEALDRALKEEEELNKKLEQELIEAKRDTLTSSFVKMVSSKRLMESGKVTDALAKLNPLFVDRSTLYKIEGRFSLFDLESNLSSYKKAKSWFKKTSIPQYVSTSLTEACGETYVLAKKEIASIVSSEAKKGNSDAQQEAQKALKELNRMVLERASKLFDPKLARELVNKAGAKEDGMRGNISKILSDENKTKYIEIIDGLLADKISPQFHNMASSIPRYIEYIEDELSATEGQKKELIGMIYNGIESGMRSAHGAIKELLSSSESVTEIIKQLTPITDNPELKIIGEKISEGGGIDGVTCIPYKTTDNTEGFIVFEHEKEIFVKLRDAVWGNNEVQISIIAGKPPFQVNINRKEARITEAGHYILREINEGEYVKIGVDEIGISAKKVLAKRFGELADNDFVCRTLKDFLSDNIEFVTSWGQRVGKSGFGWILRKG